MQSNDVFLSEGILPDKFTVCLLQLRSPFFHEANIIRGAEYPIVGWLDSGHTERQIRLKTCFDSITHFNRDVHLLILPEYAIAQDMLELVRGFVQKNSTVVVGSFYDTRERICRTFVMIPGEPPRIETGCKLRRSDFESHTLRELPQDEQKVLRIQWNINDQTLNLLVLSCLDLLQWPDFPHSIKDAEVIVASMCSPNIETFRNTAENAIRWVKPGTKRTRSRVCVLCNSVDLFENSLNTCGKSQIIGPSRLGLPTLSNAAEGGMIFDLDCLRLLTRPTPTTGQDRTVIENPSTFSLDSRWRVQWAPARKHKPGGYEIHPNAPLRIGLNKYYLFSNMKSFAGDEDYISSAPVGCLATFGFHDLIWYSWEDCWQSLLLRYQTWVPPSVARKILFDNKHCFRVKNTLKYRGRLFAERCESEEGCYRPDMLKNLEQNYIEKYLRQALAPANGQMTASKVTALAKNAIILPDLEQSDLPANAAIQGKREFFILIFIAERNSHTNPIRAFEEIVLSNELMDDDRVRTIETCEQVWPTVGGVLKAHYILHVIGHLGDVSEIVFDKIHKKCRDDGAFEGGTRVIPIAAQLSQDEKLALSETYIDDGIKRGRIFEIIAANTSERFPFVLKNLDRDSIDIVSRIWCQANLWVKFRETTGMEGSASRYSTTQLSRCLYYLAYTLAQDNDEMDKQLLSNLWYYCSPFYLELANEIEAFLGTLVHNKAEALGREFKHKLEGIWNKYSKDKKPLRLKDIEKMSLGDLIQSIIYWNNNVGKEDLIKHSEFQKRIQILQGCQLREFRDGFAHPATGLKNPVIQRYINSRKAIKRLLVSILEGLKFLIEEKYSAQL